MVHSGDIADGENERRLKDFHAGAYDVLIQVRKASEGFDAPAVSVLLKLDAVYSREPVIQQLGRGLRFNHSLSASQNMLNVFIGRDPRLGSIIEHLEREAPPPPVQRLAEGAVEYVEQDGDEAEFEGDEDEVTLPEILDVAEAGDAYLDHTGHFVDGPAADDVRRGCAAGDASDTAAGSGGLRYRGRDAGSDRVLQNLDEPRSQRASTQAWPPREPPRLAEYGLRPPEWSQGLPNYTGGIHGEG